jgi:phosphoribosylaminoimidazole-succinocarboxamide synthase
MNSIVKTDFKFTNQVSKYSGKVRDVYNINNELLVMVASDRLSAFDIVLPRGIPFKGQILNQIASKMLNATSHIIPNWLQSTPDPNVSIGSICEPFKIEMVIRGYLAGHAARLYNSGKRLICGIKMPDGMIENDKFPYPIITPTTKALDGSHDEDISKDDILKTNIVSKEDYFKLENYTLKFGKNSKGEIILIDEIHTPDSSRYFYLDTYKKLQDLKSPQRQLSKEFVRQWLINNGFQGKKGQEIPKMNDDYINGVSERYIELYEKITGTPFVKADIFNISKRIERNVESYLKSR